MKKFVLALMLAGGLFSANAALAHDWFDGPEKVHVMGFDVTEGDGTIVLERWNASTGHQYSSRCTNSTIFEHK